jgi:hypothetical protein
MALAASFVAGIFRRARGRNRRCRGCNRGRLGLPRVQVHCRGGMHAEKMLGQKRVVTISFSAGNITTTTRSKTVSSAYGGRNYV